MVLKLASFRSIFLLIAFSAVLSLGTHSTSAAPINIGASSQPLGWLPFASPTTNTLNAVDMVSATDGWIVGDSGALLRYNGNTWAQVSNPITTTLLSVSMVSGTDGWTVGYNSSNFTQLVRRWNGSTWSPVSGPSSLFLAGVSAPDNTNAWVAGGFALCAPVCDDLNGYIHRWNGSWDTTSTPHKAINSIFMLSITDGWAAGTEVITATQQYQSTIMRWNGSSWAAAPHPAVGSLQAIAAFDANTAWAVGTNGVILRWNGSNWTQATSPTTNTLSALSIISATDAWAVGANGTIIHWNGSNWVKVNSSVTTQMNGISMTSVTDGWAVGDNGTILHYGPVFNIYLPQVSK